MPTGRNSTSLSRLRQIKEKLLRQLYRFPDLIICAGHVAQNKHTPKCTSSTHHWPACSSKCACWKRGCFSVGLRQPLAAAGQLPGVLRLSQNWMNLDVSINQLLSQGVQKNMCVVGGRALDYWVGRINIIERWKLHRLYEFIAINNSLTQHFFIYDFWQIWPNDLGQVWGSI